MKRLFYSQACLLYCFFAICTTQGQTIRMNYSKIDWSVPKSSGGTITGKPVKLSFQLTGKSASVITLQIRINAIQKLPAQIRLEGAVTFLPGDWPDSAQGVTYRNVEKTITLFIESPDESDVTEEFAIEPWRSKFLQECQECHLYVRVKPEADLSSRDASPDLPKSELTTSKSNTGAPDPDTKKETPAKTPSKDSKNTAGQKDAKFSYCLVKKDTIMNPILSTANSEQDQELSIVINLTGKTSDTVTAKVKLEAFSGLESGALKGLSTESITILPDDWPDSANGNSNTVIKKIKIRTRSVEKLDDEITFNLTLEGSKCQNKFTVKITTVGMYDPTKPFWVEMGSNFDLLDGLHPNNLFGGVFMYKRDIPTFKLKEGKQVAVPTKLSIATGVYESKSTSEESSSQLSPLMYFNPNKMLRPARQPDSFYAYVDTGKFAASTSVLNTGLFFSPQYRLSNGDANTDGAHLFVSLWLEMVWQRYKTSYDYSKSGLYDSILVAKSSTMFRNIGVKPRDQTRDVRSHYFGLGLPVFFKYKDANLYFNSVLGITNQLLAPSALRPVIDTSFIHTINTSVAGSDNSGNNSLDILTTPTHHWNSFYLFQFRLSEEKYGISFTGEVRGLILKNVKPVISLALSKKFDLTKLLTFK